MPPTTSGRRLGCRELPGAAPLNLPTPAHIAPANPTEAHATRHTGRGQCGRVGFGVGGEIDSGLACDWAVGGKRASLWGFAWREKFVLKTPDTDEASYTFNKHHIRHRFCRTCGIHAWGEAN